MGLFQGKQQHKQTSPVDEAAEVALEVFDDAYRDELRSNGRKYFDKILSENAARLNKDLDTTVAHINVDVKDYMTTRLDAMIARIDAEIMKRLDERLEKYDRLLKDAQDLAVQSLNRNAQTLHDKYQQLNTSLQQTVASQEVMIITAFDETKARINTTQTIQDAVLETLKKSIKDSQDQTEQMSEVLQQSVTDRTTLLSELYEKNVQQLNGVESAQNQALQSIESSARAVQQQYDQLNEMLEKTIADQKAAMIDAFQDDMARVIEHYVLGALGDQYDMKAQLPAIIQQMEANKQAMVDDMKL